MDTAKAAGAVAYMQSIAGLQAGVYPPLAHAAPVGSSLPHPLPQK